MSGSKIKYNDLLHKACEIHYIRGEVPSKKIIHTHAWNLPNLIPNLKHDIILCMAQGDESIVQIGNKFRITHCGQTKYEFELPKYVKKFFCIHCGTNDERIQGVPCGIMDSGPSVQVLEEVEQEDISKENLLYVNFHPYNHPARAKLLNHFRQFKWATVENHIPQREYFCKIKRHYFTLCPAGIGLDCFRTWETLYLDSIPIVHEGCHHHFNLPILTVPLDRMFYITREYLEGKYKEVNRKQRDELWEEHWIERVRNEALRLS